MVGSKEVERWYVSNLKKMINWKKVKTDGVKPTKNKDLLVLWGLVQGRPGPTWSKRSEEEMYMYGGVNAKVNNNLCKGNEQNQVTSVLI